MRPQLILDSRTASVDLSAIFGGKLLVIDKEVAKFLDLRGLAPISFTEPSNFKANWFEDPYEGLSIIDRSTALGVLRFLDDTSATSNILAIPGTEDEMNLILGVIEFEGERRVLYLEHELEEGEVEQFHLHSRPEADYMIKVKENRRYLVKAS